MTLWRNRSANSWWLTPAGARQRRPPAALSGSHPNDLGSSRGYLHRRGSDNPCDGRQGAASDVTRDRAGASPLVPSDLYGPHDSHQSIYASGVVSRRDDLHDGIV